MTNCQSIIQDLRNCNDDHIGENRLMEARSELKEFLNCDDYELNRFIELFIDITTTVEVRVKGE